MSSKIALFASTLLCIFNLTAVNSFAQSVRAVEYFSPPGQPFQVGSIETAVVQSTGLVYSAGVTYGVRFAVINPTTNTPMAFIDSQLAGNNTSAVAYSQVNQTANLVYFSGSGATSILVVDGRPSSPTFNKLLPPLQFPGQVVRSFVLDETRSRLYVTSTNTADARVGRINIVDANPASSTFHQTLAVVSLPSSGATNGIGAAGIAVNPATNKIYVTVATTGSTNGGIYTLDGATQTITKISGTVISSVVIVNPASNLIYGGGNTASFYAIDGATDALIGTITVPAASGLFNEQLALNRTTGRVYVSNFSNQLLVIDGNRASSTFNTLLTTVENVGSLGIVVDESTNKIAAVTSSPTSNTNIVDGVTNTIVATIPGQTNPSDIALNPATDRIFVANQLFAVQHVNLADNALVSTISTGADAGIGVVSPLNNLYYTARARATTDLPFFDGDGIAGTVSGLPHNNGRFLRVVQNTTTNRLYAINSARDIANTSSVPSYAAVINPATNAVIANVEIGGQCLDAGVNEATDKIYILCFGFGSALPRSIHVIDGATNIAATVDVTAFPANDGFFNGPIVANSTTNRIYFRTNNGAAGVVNGATNVATPLPYTSVLSVAVNQTLNRIYILTATSLRVLNGATDAEIANIPLSSTAFQGLEINETTGRIFVPNPIEDTLTVINGSTNTVVGTVPTGDNPIVVAVNAADNRIYVGNSNPVTRDFSITFIDGGNLTVRKTLSLPLSPSRIAVSASTKRIYVSSILDTAAGVLVIADSVSSVPFDFDGDGRADLAAFRPSSAVWYLQRSTEGFAASEWGLATDKLAPADYDGDGKTDITVWRESERNFYIINSRDRTIRVENFGLAGDILTIGDWDGDGKADPSVYRAGAQGIFYYRGSLNNPNNNITFLEWGTTGDRPMRGDFDGDGKFDRAVFRPSNATWYILQSSNNQVRYVNFGLATDALVPADYDGDGKTDFAVVRNRVWYILQSSNDQIRYENFGLADDALVPADYDGDGKTDVAVYRDGIWYVKQSTNSAVSYRNFGLGSDIAVPSVYIAP